MLRANIFGCYIQKKFKSQCLLESGAELFPVNAYFNEVDALFDFNGHINTYEFENAGSKDVKNIKEQCGDE